MKRDNSSIKAILLSFIAICAGASVYILFRPAEASFLNWFTFLESGHWLDALRDRSLSLSSLLPKWLLFSLPDGLWAFAFTLLVLSIWSGSNSLLRYFWYLSIPLLVFGFEILQLTGALRGTFCLNDILLSAMGIALGVIIVKVNPGINNNGLLFEPSK